MTGFKILSVVQRRYYNRPTATEPMYLYFTEPLRALGHQVETFDPTEESARFGRVQATERLCELVQSGNFDAVFYQTSGKELVDTGQLAPLSKSTRIVAWNSDDDWQWSITRQIANHFTYMITTYPSVFEQNRGAFPNLLLSQWACMGPAPAAVDKDIDFSFAGAVYKTRNEECRALRRRAGLRCFGRGARLVNLGLPYFRGAFRFDVLCGAAIDFSEINAIWNRTRVSYTPLRGGPDGEVLSLKSRIFDMGLSGTLMLCERAPDLERYYESGAECVVFEGLEDCADKARYYLAHEAERARIAARYAERTGREHLWTHRFQAIFKQIGLA